MTQDRWFQLIGAFALFGLAAVFISIAASTRRVERYGREAILTAGAFFIVTGLIRSFNAFGWLGVEKARYASAIFAWVFLVIAIEALYLDRVDRRTAARIERRNDGATSAL